MKKKKKRKKIKNKKYIQITYIIPEDDANDWDVEQYYLDRHIK